MVRLVDDRAAWAELPTLTERFFEPGQLRADIEVLLRTSPTDAALRRHAEEKGAARLERGVTLYGPLYLSSICMSGCTYCGFRATAGNRIRRRRLRPEEAVIEADALTAQGIEHILLVAGDDPTLVSRPNTRHGERKGYLEEVLQRLSRPDRTLWLEIPPQSVASCRRLVEAGATTFVHAQETYQRGPYLELHTHGQKRDFDLRLGAVERALEGGAKRVGLGALWGLAEPAADLAALVSHVRSIRTRYPDADVSVSAPRLRAGPPGFVVPHPISDEKFERIVMLLSHLLPSSVDLVLSTRESPALRDRLLRYGATLMSAGSKTSPGIYASTAPDAAAQFELADERSVAVVAQAVRDQGYVLSSKPRCGRAS